ncbi:MAG: hypothetical protein QNJ72_04845 [Pleurocapsa sp. MO_226.B13]|nr:hypothetical protein [Pleurocapsa sp. MO_226.B13]
MSIDRNSARRLELESKLVKIAKLNCVSKPNMGTARMLYCGRHRSRSSSGFNPLDLGLGNPYSYKKSKNCIWRVNNLDECLKYYRQWLWKLIQNEHSQENLADWERMYLYRFLHLCSVIDSVRTLVCFCIDTNHNTKNTQISCHTQILWNAAVWYVCQKI